ncbi:unnamed protein product [Pedinophyceae sp. YPF-701]|nr:unnamed protein product [Pedinophyceae sp. YPF-701]
MMPTRRPRRWAELAKRLFRTYRTTNTGLIFLAVVLVYMYLDYRHSTCPYHSGQPPKALRLDDVVLHPATLPSSSGQCKRAVRGAFDAAQETYPDLDQASARQAMKGVVMALYGAGKDAVSDAIRTHAQWEEGNIAVLQRMLRNVEALEGVRPTFVDIGANLGWFTFRHLSQGYRVVSFEPMKSNLAALLTTHCLTGPRHLHRNMHTVIAVGLSDSKQDCRLVSEEHNVGDGILECGAGDKPVAEGYHVASHMPLDTIDNLIIEGLFDPGPVSVVKIDIEGHEYFAFSGAAAWLKSSRRPKFVLTEMWQVRGTATQYVRLMADAGYEVHVRESAKSESFVRMAVPAAVDWAREWEGGKRPEQGIITDVIFAQPGIL